MQRKIVVMSFRETLGVPEKLFPFKNCQNSMYCKKNFFLISFVGQSHTLKYRETFAFFT